MSPLATALAAEQAAVYLFGVLGARATDPGLTADLRTAYQEHADARDALTDEIRAAGATPPGPAVAYAVPSSWHGDAALRAGAIDVQRRCTAAYVTAVGRAAGDDRRTLATGAGTSAAREVALGAGVTALPGLRGKSLRRPAT